MDQDAHTGVVVGEERVEGGEAIVGGEKGGWRSVGGSGGEGNRVLGRECEQEGR